jgi:gamma-glutamyl:cysteine ligase YbdK (ATP-grasp superfamily)
LVREWATTNGTSYEDLSALCQNIATQAARWGADIELEACCEWLDREGWSGESRQLRDARRPKPPSLKEQALETLKYPKDFWSEAEVDTIRRALEELPDN